VRDRPAEAGGAIAHRLHLIGREYSPPGGPTCWPLPETYAGMRRIARAVLPGARFRRRLLWRYSLLWAKPASQP
jgi:hypothetical protein